MISFYKDLSMGLVQSRYRYVVVGFNGDPANTGFASRVSAVVAEMTEDGSRALVVRFVPMPHLGRSWKKSWQRTDKVSLLEVPALPISRYRILRKLSVTLCTHILQAIIAYVRPELVQCECHEAASLGNKLNFCGRLYADIHGAAPEEAKYSRLTTGRSDMSIVQWLDEVETQMVRRFDKLIVVSPKMIEHLEVKTGISIKDKSEVLPVFANQTFFKPLRKEHWKRELGLNGKIVFLYSGGMQKYQCIDETITWFKGLRARIPNACLLMFTPTPEQAAQKVRALASEYILDIKIASVDPADLADYVSAADFGFVLREQEILNKVSSPTKAVEYLSRGVQLICTSDAGSAADYVSHYGSGLIVPLKPTPKDINQAAEKIARLLTAGVPFDAIHAQLSREGYADAIGKLYGPAA